MSIRILLIVMLFASPCMADNIQIDQATQKQLRDIQLNINLMQDKFKTICETYLRAKGVEDGKYNLAEDFTKFVEGERDE